MMALPHAVITTPVSMPLNARISSSLIIEGTLQRTLNAHPRSAWMGGPFSLDDRWCGFSLPLLRTVQLAAACVCDICQNDADLSF
jgi:hypothetical protein